MFVSFMPRGTSQIWRVTDVRYMRGSCHGILILITVKAASCNRLGHIALCDGSKLDDFRLSGQVLALLLQSTNAYKRRRFWKRLDLERWRTKDCCRENKPMDFRYHRHHRRDGRLSLRTGSSRLCGSLVQ